MENSNGIRQKKRQFVNHRVTAQSELRCVPMNSTQPEAVSSASTCKRLAAS